MWHVYCQHALLLYKNCKSDLFEYLHVFTTRKYYVFFLMNFKVASIMYMNSYQVLEHFSGIPVEVEMWICHNLFSGLYSPIVADLCLNYYLLQFTFLFIALKVWAHKENALFARRQPFLLCIMKLCPFYIHAVQSAC